MAKCLTGVTVAESQPCGRRTGFGGPTPPERSPTPAATRPDHTCGAREWSTLASGFGLPEPWVECDEAVGVHVQLRGEAPAVALVGVDRVARAPVDLLERLYGQPRKAEPGGAHRRGLARGEGEPADGEQVGGRREAEVDIQASGHRGARGVVEPPVPVRVAPDLEADRAVAPPSRHGPVHRSPPMIADHAIVEATRLSRLHEHRGAGEVPLPIVEEEASAVVTRLVEPSPEHGRDHHPSSVKGRISSMKRCMRARCSSRLRRGASNTMWPTPTPA